MEPISGPEDSEEEWQTLQVEFMDRSWYNHECKKVREDLKTKQQQQVIAWVSL